MRWQIRIWKPGNQEDSNQERRKRFFFIPKVPHFARRLGSRRALV